VKIVVVAVGKLKDRALRAVADDYLDRLRRYVRCEEIEVRDDAALARAVPVEATVVALEVLGDLVTSEQLAQRVERWGSQHKGIVALLVGGAEGLPPELSRGAHARLSLSRLTLPHRLARVLLYEQLYRAMTILRGEPYAREG
jgi:23S rRNA (pseudouridine1915-N3)-methyltransferase